jgi:hypothetical protein
MSLEMAHKVILPPKKIISRSFLNSGTLIVIISSPPLLSSEVLSPAVHLLALRQTVGDHDSFKAEFLLLVYRNKTLLKAK